MNGVKKYSLFLALIVVGIIFSGCARSDDGASSPLVYSFCGDNENYSITNGVLVLDGEHDAFYGGNIELKNKEILKNITCYHITFFASFGAEPIILESDSVEHEDEVIESIQSELGSQSGDILIENNMKNPLSSLWVELKTADTEGQEQTYSLDLNFKEVTQTNN